MDLRPSFPSATQGAMARFSPPRKALSYILGHTSPCTRRRYGTLPSAEEGAIIYLCFICWLVDGVAEWLGSWRAEVKKLVWVWLDWRECQA